MEHTTYVKNDVVDHNVFRKPQADVCISLNHRGRTGTVLVLQFYYLEAEEPSLCFS
jgi:hypothetical protein